MGIAEGLLGTLLTGRSAPERETRQGAADRHQAHVLKLQVMEERLTEILEESDDPKRDLAEFLSRLAPTDVAPSESAAFWRLLGKVLARL